MGGCPVAPVRGGGPFDPTLMRCSSIKIDRQRDIKD